MHTTSTRDDLRKGEAPLSGEEKGRAWPDGKRRRKRQCFPPPWRGKLTIPLQGKKSTGKHTEGRSIGEWSRKWGEKGRSTLLILPQEEGKEVTSD